MEIDGLTIEQVRYNIYAFGRDVRIFARRVERARLEHTKAKWQRKLANAKGYLENNQERLARFEAVEHSVQPTSESGRDLPVESNDNQGSAPAESG